MPMVKWSQKFEELAEFFELVERIKNATSVVVFCLRDAKFDLKFSKESKLLVLLADEQIIQKQSASTLSYFDVLQPIKCRHNCNLRVNAGIINFTCSKKIFMSKTLIETMLL